MDKMDFKFKWLNQEGGADGVFSKRGRFDGDTLVLDDVELPSTILVDVDYRERNMWFSIYGEEGEEKTFGIFVSRGSPEQLKLALGRARSGAWAAHRREELVAEGRGFEYLDATCPHCNSVIDLTGFEKSPQVYCEFCHTVGTLDRPEGVRHDECKYRLCEECEMYSKPRRFTIFYFYYIVVTLGIVSRPTWRCPGCMRGEAWKMLFANLIFVLGVPIALMQLVRSYGGADLGGLYPGLDTANLNARNGKFQKAIAGYLKILDKQPVAAGIKYNIAQAFIKQGDLSGAAQMFEYALKDCSNYPLAAYALVDCYESLGEHDQRDAVLEPWLNQGEDAAHPAHGDGVDSPAW